MPVDTERVVMTKVTVTLPQPLVEDYLEQARKAGKGLNAEVEDRLTRCAAHTSRTRPLYFNDSERSKLEACLGAIISSPAEALAHIRKLKQVSVAGIKVELDEEITRRIGFRVYTGETLESVVQREVTRALRRFCGL